jgi:hypothetical protein
MQDIIHLTPEDARLLVMAVIKHHVDQENFGLSIWIILEELEKKNHSFIASFIKRVCKANKINTNQPVIKIFESPIDV